MKQKLKKYLPWALLVFIIIAQFFRIDKTNPESDPANDFITINNPPPELATLMKNACYDCHSNHTRYPWYTNIAPVSWWIKGHINYAREQVNFSEWTAYDAKKANHKLEECVEWVGEGKMPLKSYAWLHKEAKMTDTQRKELADWFEGLQGGSSNVHEEEEHEEEEHEDH
jgi:hypothetical protein